MVSPSTGPLATELRTALSRTDGIQVQDYAEVNALRTAVRRNEVSGGVVVPVDYDDAVRSGRHPAVQLVVDPANSDTVAVRTRVSTALAEQAALVQAATFTQGETGEPFDAALARARQLSAAAPDLRAGSDVRVSSAGTTTLSTVGIAQYATIGELVLFLFLIGLTGAGDLMESRRLGVTRRMLGTPTPAWALLVGEGLGRFAIAVAQALVILLVGSLLFGISWGNPLGVLAVVLVFSLVVAGVSLLVGASAPTAELATSIGPPIGIALGMLGGCMWPLELAGAPMRIIANFTPQAWAVSAFVDLAGEQATLAQVLPQLAVLFGFAVGLLGLAVWRLRRTVLR